MTINQKNQVLELILLKILNYGYFGYSLHLKGLDKTNSNAKLRKIIFHSTKKMHSKWSWGCFSLPEKNTRKIIDLIKGGCLVYAYK
jgi:hypothetical protein